MSACPSEIIHPSTSTFSILISKIAKEFPPKLSETVPEKLVCTLVFTHTSLDLIAAHQRNQFERANFHI